MNIIYFENRKGSRGLFRVYIDRYKTSKGKINNVQFIRNNKEIDIANHNLKDDITTLNNKKAFYDAKNKLSERMSITARHN